MIAVRDIERELRRLNPSDARHWSTIDATTVAGEPRESILAVASRANAALIVLGLPRRSRFEAIVAGTTGHGVLRRAASPVLLVPGAHTLPRSSLAEPYDWWPSAPRPLLGSTGLVKQMRAGTPTR